MRNGLRVSRSYGDHRPEGLWRRRHAYAIRLASCFFSITLATVYAQFFERSAPAVNLIWVTNGLLLTYLLLAPRWLWPGYLIAGTAAMTFGSALIGETWQINLLFNALNLVEVLIGALLLRRKSTQLPRFTDRRYLAQFVGFAVLAGPIAASAILKLVIAVWGHTAQLGSPLDWIIGDGLGTAVIVPTFVAIFAARFRNSANLRKHWHSPFLLAVVALAAFSQNKMPFFILIFPVLVFVLMRLGLGWAALSTLFVAASASWYSIHGSGPFAISGSVHPVEASIQLQFFLACCIFTIYLVSVVLEERDATEYRLQEVASIHSMVTDNSRDVILLADLDGRCTYASPAVESMNGWRPAELIKQTLSEQAHPEDRARVEDAVRRVRHGSEGTILEYRTRKRNGDYVWVESSLRLFRDRKTRIPAGILSLVRDIAERKHSEDLLLRAYEALEELAVVDALTGVANRRRFNEYLSSEWNRSARLQKSISLLLIDADCFKQHNDAYGHLSGDRRLKQIAEAAIEAAKRPEDLVARFGGDEFAVILPDTDNQGAVEVGRKIREVLNERNPMCDENAGQFVTVSIGCATAIPKPGEQAEALIQVADEALYFAKRNGRDQLCNGFGPLPSLGATVGDGPESASYGN
jgi:diguanylate cyclase (GGDEF)-like protein/PAS domain S-box-containing protein